MTTPRALTRTVVVLATATVLVAGCAVQPTGLHASGRVADDTHPIAAPALAGAVAVRVTDAAPLGTRVRSGDPIAHVDAAAQDAALAVAHADAGLAARRVELLASQADDVRDKRADLRAKRRDLVKGIDTMTTKRPELLRTRADLRSKRDDLTTQLTALTAQREALAAAPDSPQRTAALAQLDEGLAKANAGATQLKAGLAKLDAGLKALDRNLAQARSGLRTLDTGLAELADAETQLSNAGELARITASASSIAISRAEHQRSLATLVAPADGVVVASSLPGDVVAPGAPVVVVRPDAPATATAWVQPDAAASTCAGAPASVTTDWGTTHPATVARVGVRAEYPPTAQATDEIHLTRAVEVTVTVAEALPPGAPVDLTWSACHEEN